MSDREIMNAKNYGPNVHSYIGRWKFAIHDLATQIAPVVSEQIQETIAWQTEGYEFCEHLDGDDYMQFANELRNEIVKKLKEI